jgi:hypothetical protein
MEGGNHMKSKADISKMSPITRKLDASLKADGFSLLESMRIIGGQGQAVNELQYLRKQERVIVIVHEPVPVK